MPYELVWTEDRGLLRIFSGSINANDILTGVLIAHGDPRFEKIRYIINDFLQVDAFSVDNDDIKVISAMGKAASLTNPRLKVAIVSTHDAILELGTFYCQRVASTPVECRNFHSMDDCKQWIYA